MLDDAEIKEWIEPGGVPIVNGSDSQLAGSSDDADFLKFVYDVVQQGARSSPSRGTRR